jgi:DNA-binding GntR family transcriptional regulator
VICVKSDDNRVKAGNAGAIEAVVTAMSAHARNVEVQRYGCGALWSITADNAENKIKAGSAGAIEAVVAAMRTHAGHAGVQERSRAVLGHLNAS